MKNNPRIGISLPTSFLNDNYSGTSEIWHQMFGSSRECLKLLQDCGVKSIEINDLHMGPPVEDIEPAIENVLAAELGLTVHIFLPELARTGELPESLKRVCRVINSKNLGRSGIPLTTHGHKVYEPAARADVRERTVNDLGLLTLKLKEEGLYLPLGLELCRDKKEGPIGVTYQELLGMVEQVRGAEIGICWDLGHTLYNVREQQWEEPLPPESFLDRIIHTHIHDLDQNMLTHSPLNQDNKLLNSFLKELKNSNYSGAYNLELYPHHWTGSFEDRRGKVIQSIYFLGSV